MSVFNGKAYAYLTLEVKTDNVVLYGWGTYPASSVLAGQQSKQYLRSFPGVETAENAYPMVGFSNAYTEREISLSHLSDTEG